MVHTSYGAKFPKQLLGGHSQSIVQSGHMRVVVMAAHAGRLLQTGHFLSNRAREWWQIVAIDPWATFPNRVRRQIAVVAKIDQN